MEPTGTDPAGTDPTATLEAKLRTFAGDLTDNERARLFAVFEQAAGAAPEVAGLQQRTPSADDLFSSISNVLKTRHDTVKNSIGNIR